MERTAGSSATKNINSGEGIQRAMSINESHRITAALTLALTALCAAGIATAQSLRVTAANASAPNAVYDVLFNPAGTTLLNSDGSSLASTRSLVFVPGTTSGVDLVVADTAGGRILRYLAPSGTPTEASLAVWSAASNIPGPQHPDGLSVDTAGDLYATTDLPRPAVWVLQPSATASGGFAAPLLLDARFGGHEVDSLVDTTVVPANLPPATAAALASNGVHAGDLLVLVADNDFDPSDPREGVTVFDYPAASIAAYLADPTKPIAPPLVALRQRQFSDCPSSRSALPTGLDIWPSDGSLLLATSKGTILQYTLPAAPGMPALWTQSHGTTFADIDCGWGGCPFGKLRAGSQADNAFAFVAQATGAGSGNILQFAVPLATPTPPAGFGFTTPAASVPTSASTTADSTTGRPEGLALAHQSVVVAAAATCASPAGCNPTGGLANMIDPGSAGVGPDGVHGNVVQQTCVVTDTRVQPDGSCPGNLNIAQQCPTFPANFITPVICGSSGPKKNQLAVILSIANGVDDVPGILVTSAVSPEALIPGTQAEPCNSGQAVGWTPRLGSAEGVIPEGAAVIDMTSFCDTKGGSTRGNSVWVVGGQLSPTVSGSRRALIGFANDKLLNLGKTIEAANIARPVKEKLGACLIRSAVLLNTGRFTCAARKIARCDDVAEDAAKSFGTSPDNPNPFGDVRGRLGNIFYTINTRIQGNPPNRTWPLTSAPPQCNDGDDDRDDH
jgi:hypothetical protein